MFTCCGPVMPYGDIDLVNIALGTGLLPDGTKPLPEPILTYHEKHSVAFTWELFHIWIKSMAYLHRLHFSNYYHVLLQPQWVNWWEGEKPAHRTLDMQNNASINSITMTTVNTIDRKPKASINTLRPEQSDHHFANDFKMQ